MWQRLYKKKIYIVLPGEATIVNRPGISENGRKTLLENSQIEPGGAESVLERINQNWFEHGVAINLQRLLNLLSDENSTSPAEAVVKQMLMLSRVKLQGTDGMRGKILVGDFSYFEALSLYLQEGTIVPALFELASFSFATLLLENRQIAPEDTCTFGEDGRDILTKGEFTKAVIRGFNQADISVYNTGVLATPGVILYAAYAQSRIGAILTASHNPADQNGLKFIFDGFKLLEESPAGEFALTAMMYKLANNKQLKAAKLMFTDVHTEAEKLLIETNIANSWLKPGDLKKVKVVYDGANGAYSLTAPRVLDSLGIEYISVNTNPLGHNINKGGGVAELEGTAFFQGESYLKNGTGHFLTLDKMFEIGRKQPELFLCAIVNDGDGDRGYLLVYDSEENRVWVLSGDELAIWVAEGMRNRGEVNSDSVFVASVETDLLVSVHAQNKLNLRTEIACVGDKWLLEPARRGRNFAVGVEESGHVTFGCKIENCSGSQVQVFTGNGILSALRALAVFSNRPREIAEIIHPFEHGFKDSRSVYFVDKSRFYPGSRVWQEDAELIHLQLRAHLQEPFSTNQITFENDPSMLYTAVVNQEGNSVAAIFVRNSGTENKTVVTIRGTKQFEELLTRTMLKIHYHHMDVLKDMGSLDAINESIVNKLLNKTPQSLTILKSNLEKELNASISQVDFYALIYAMRKQRLVTIENNLLKPVAHKVDV